MNKIGAKKGKIGNGISRKGGRKIKMVLACCENGVKKLSLKGDSQKANCDRGVCRWPKGAITNKISAKKGKIGNGISCEGGRKIKKWYLHVVKMGWRSCP
jgi:hypothetical protein